MSIDGRYQTLMSFRMPDHLREELSKASGFLGIPDSEFLRRAITSALVKHAQRIDPRSAEIAEGMPLPFGQM